MYRIVPLKRTGSWGIIARRFLSVVKGTVLMSMSSITMEPGKEGGRKFCSNRKFAEGFTFPEAEAVVVLLALSIGFSTREDPRIKGECLTS